ncbi:hypothetical protein Btru_055847 [Bulinus truncatus]|nr:hypothetical protein Btru_055847 [Bulinus truncatus]
MENSKYNLENDYNGNIDYLVHNQDNHGNGSNEPLINNQDNHGNGSMESLKQKQDDKSNVNSNLLKPNQHTKQGIDNIKEEPEYSEPIGIRQCIPIIMSLIAVTVSIISITLAVIYSTNLPTQNNEQIVDEIEMTNLSCIDCKMFQSDELQYYLNQLTRYTNGNDDECCAQNLSQLSALIALNLSIISDVDEELPPVVNPDNFSMSRASMHKKLIASTFTEHDKEYPIFDPLQSYNLKFATDENSPLLEHNRNIELLATGTKITESGMYLVYCSVHFKPDSPEPCKTFTEKIFSVNITKVNSESRPESNVLLSATHTCCDDCIRNQETGFTSGVFQLKKNDFLKVDVSAEGLVSYKPQSTFFGLAMLSKTD